MLFGDDDNHVSRFGDARAAPAFLNALIMFKKRHSPCK